MDDRLIQIYEKNIKHSIISDPKSIEKCINESYHLGVQDVLDWLSKMDHLSDNIPYIIQEWNNQKKI